jgi:hypothetical protein
MRGRCFSKFSKRFHGPFPISKRIGPVAYELSLPPEARIHPVFHVSKLKVFHGTPPSALPSLDPSVIGTAIPLQPLNILGARSVHTKKGKVQQLLVQWEGLPAREATWEDQNELLKAYPNLHLEDKLNLEGVSTDTHVPLAEASDGIIGLRQDKSPIVARTRQAPVWTKDYVLGDTRKATRKR